MVCVLWHTCMCGLKLCTLIHFIESRSLWWCLNVLWKFHAFWIKFDVYLYTATLIFSHLLLSSTKIGAVLDCTICHPLMGVKKINKCRHRCDICHQGGPIMPGWQIVPQQLRQKWVLFWRAESSPAHQQTVLSDSMPSVIIRFITFFNTLWASLPDTFLQPLPVLVWLCHSRGTFYLHVAVHWRCQRLPKRLDTNN